MNFHSCFWSNHSSIAGQCSHIATGDWTLPPKKKKLNTENKTLTDPKSHAQRNKERSRLL